MTKSFDPDEPVTPVKIGRILSTEELGCSIHEAAVHGDKRKLKRLLKTGTYYDTSITIKHILLHHIHLFIYFNDSKITYPAFYCKHPTLVNLVLEI